MRFRLICIKHSKFYKKNDVSIGVQKQFCSSSSVNTSLFLFKKSIISFFSGGTLRLAIRFVNQYEPNQARMLFRYHIIFLKNFWNLLSLNKHFDKLTYKKWTINTTISKKFSVSMCKSWQIYYIINLHIYLQNSMNLTYNSPCREHSYNYISMHLIFLLCILPMCPQNHYTSSLLRDFLWCRDDFCCLPK